MLMAKRNMMAESNGGIPANCVEVEWIRFTSGSTAYVVDTGIIMNDMMGYRILVDGSNEINMYICGSGEAANNVRNFAVFSTNNYFYGWNTGVTTTVPKTEKAEIKINWRNSRKAEINGENTSYVGNLTQQLATQVSTFVFTGARTSSGAFTNPSGCAVREFGMTFGDAEILKMVAVRRKTDGLGYFCDTLTGDLYGIGGKGGQGFPTIKVGPDKE